MNDRTTDWCKALRSSARDACVEMRRIGPSVEIRDTKDKGRGPTLAVSPSAFQAWVAGAKRGELDHLV